MQTHVIIKYDKNIMILVSYDVGDNYTFEECRFHMSVEKVFKKKQNYYIIITTYIIYKKVQ